MKSDPRSELRVAPATSQTGGGDRKRAEVTRTSSKFPDRTVPKSSIIVFVDFALLVSRIPHPTPYHMHVSAIAPELQRRLNVSFASFFVSRLFLPYVLRRPVYAFCHNR